MSELSFSDFEQHEIERRKIDAWWRDRDAVIVKAQDDWEQKFYIKQLCEKQKLLAQETTSNELALRSLRDKLEDTQCVTIY